MVAYNYCALLNDLFLVSSAHCSFRRKPRPEPWLRATFISFEMSS